MVLWFVNLGCKCCRNSIETIGGEPLTLENPPGFIILLVSGLTEIIFDLI